MKLLVLGGTHFAGRAIVEAALAAGDDVTTLNRGHSGPPADGVRQLTADRTDTAELHAAVPAGEEWDAVIDTWTWPPRAVAASADLLKDRTPIYGYVSTVSVYTDPLPAGVDEQNETVAGDPDSDETADYQAAKRGCELAVLRAFGPDRTLLGRPGLILGPYENVGRLPWWLGRIERGGRVLAPGDPDRPIQYIDVRDLATWMLDSVRDRRTGAYNLVSEPGHTTMAAILEKAVAVTGSDAELVWAPDKLILDAGISPWTELPIYVPRDPEWDGVYEINASKAGLTARPADDTVAATYAWLQAEGYPPDRPGLGLDAEKEREVLGALGGGPA
jgi:2'-hydroxyisoflavone reductase